MRSKVPFLLVFLIPFLISPLHAGMLKMERNMDRPGKDFRGFKNIQSARKCQDLCKGNRRCVAWTWVRPGLQGPTGRCWLKDSVPRRVRNECCVSGIVSRGSASGSCRWKQYGSSYECLCKNRRGKWIQSNPGRCKDPKPSPRVLDPGFDDPGGSCVLGQC
ncbi:MAG: hypothetical protein GWO19_03475 [Nitrospinaceae bacterium]|nr:hypothetical protein [Nitrospinaceae bacterium]NIU97470.1 hypothetical protein [Nitrospinaceae bacterium]